MLQSDIDISSLDQKSAMTLIIYYRWYEIFSFFILNTIGVVTYFPVVTESFNMFKVKVNHATAPNAQWFNYLIKVQ